MDSVKSDPPHEDLGGIATLEKLLFIHYFERGCWKCEPFDTGPLKMQF